MKPGKYQILETSDIIVSVEHGESGWGGKHLELEQDEEEGISVILDLWFILQTKCPLTTKFNGLISIYDIRIVCNV